jgi:hypothetical protein
MMELFVETHVLNDDHQKGVQQLIDSRAQHFCGLLVFNFFFLKLLFF